MIMIIEPNRRIRITSMKNVHTITATTLCHYIIVVVNIIATLYTEFRRGFSCVQTFSVGLRNAHYNHHRALLCFSITGLYLFFCDNIALGTSQKFLFSFKHTHIILLLFTVGGITFFLSCSSTHNR